MIRVKIYHNKNYLGSFNCNEIIGDFKTSKSSLPLKTFLQKGSSINLFGSYTVPYRGVVDFKCI